MIRCTVDTNVLIVANGFIPSSEGTHRPTLSCHLAAVEFLTLLFQNGRAVVDLDGEIQNEYRRHLNPKGQPGVGDRFFREVLNWNEKLVERVALPKEPNGEYQALPLILIATAFDPSDRKFAALANQERIPVYNAVDSDWLNHQAQLAECDISVVHICGATSSDWFQHS